VRAEHLGDATLDLTLQARALLDSAWSLPRTDDVEERRRNARRWALEGSGEPEPVASVEALDVAGVPARLYRPTGSERDVLVWLHGGGWTLLDLDCYDAVVRALANRAGCAVLSVDYRLAPEHRYPAAIDDAWAATEWAAGPFERLAVGGDSVGGNLAAAVALRARDRGVPLALQLLVYPVLDYAAVDASFYEDYERRYAHFADKRRFGAESRTLIRKIWETYVPEPAKRDEPDASPAQATSLAGLAPALVVTAEHDILRGEDEDYARRLEAEGVEVALVTYERQVHGFFPMLGVTDDARDAVRRAAAALRRGFSR